MFSNNINLNANKLPILVPSNASSNITSTSHHGSTQSLNIPEQQQPSLNSPRSTLTTNSNNTDSSLLICGPTANSLTHSNPPFPPLYGNSATTLANPGAGREYIPRCKHHRHLFDLDAHLNLQNLIAMSQVNNGGKYPRIE